MILEVENYCKTIKGKTILNNINLKLESGHVYGFQGRNGCGKTMLFRAICTLIYPTSGDVLIDGKSILENDFDLSQMGILLEEPGFYPGLTGEENLSMLYEINHKKDPAYIHSVMTDFDMEAFTTVRYSDYSLGTKQKLRILQAVMEDQKIIILDEPMNSLDERSVVMVRNLILRLKEEGKLVLLASHNREDLETLCDVIYKMDQGAILE